MKRKGRTAAAFCGLLLLMLRPAEARQSAAQAIRQSAEVVFPSLFPFFVVSRQLTGSLRLRRTSFVPFLMGLCGGYPLGVYSACQLYRQGALSETQTRRALRCCNNTGPAIFFGMIGAVLFPNPAVCAWLFAIHVLSAFLTAWIVTGPAREEAARPLPPVKPPEPLLDSVLQSARACAGLCASVVFFTMLLRLLLGLSAVRLLLSCLPLDRSVSEALLCALADLPSGLNAMAQIADPAVRLVLCAGSVGWGGVCVHLQAAGIWRGTGLRPKGYFPAKALQALISCALAFVPARLSFGAALPLWPAALPFFAAAGKKAMAFSRNMGYNEKNRTGRRRNHAVSQKNRAGLRLLRPGGEN